MPAGDGRGRDGMKKVRVALAQMAMSPEFDTNVRKCLKLMERAHSRGAKMICYPELQFTRFFPRHRKHKRAHKHAMSTRHPVVGAFRQKAQELGMVCVLNFYEKSGGKYYDSSPVIDADGRLLGVSRMVHIVQTKHYYEQDYYAPSNTGFRVYDTKYGKVGVVICFDRHFPESVRIAALKGAQVVFAPSANLKGEPLELFEAEMRVAAYQNSVYVAAVNRVGREGPVTYCGESLIAGPLGKTITKAGGREQLVIADIDYAQIAKARKERPFLTLRQSRHYGAITRGKSRAKSKKT